MKHLSSSLLWSFVFERYQFVFLVYHVKRASLFPMLLFLLNKEAVFCVKSMGANTLSPWSLQKDILRGGRSGLQ